MRQLSRWMKAVGIFYVINGAALTVVYLVPAAQRGMISQVVPGTDAADPLAGYALEIWLMFALEVLVIGGFLLAGSRDAWANRILALTVLGLELIRGILDDLIWIASGYPAGFYVGWIAVHSLIIVTGVFALRRAYAVHRGDALVPGTGEQDQIQAISSERRG